MALVITRLQIEADFTAASPGEQLVRVGVFFLKFKDRSAGSRSLFLELSAGSIYLHSVSCLVILPGI